MKVSVSLPESTMHFMDSYLSTHPKVNRSQMVQRALELLRLKELECAYQEANSEIDSSFECASADGLHEAW